MRALASYIHAIPELNMQMPLALKLLHAFRIFRIWNASNPSAEKLARMHHPWWMRPRTVGAGRSIRSLVAITHVASVPPRSVIDPAKAVCVRGRAHGSEI